MATTQTNTAQIKDLSVSAAKVGTDVLITAGTHAFTGDQSMGGNKLTNVGTPSASTDAANKGYVDSAIQGLDQKPTARAATTAALPTNTYANGTAGVGATLTANANAVLAAQDGVTLIVGDLLLVKDEASQLKNGLYQVTSVGAVGAPWVLTRHADMDSAAEFSGAFVPVGQEGTTNKNSLWLGNWSASFVTGTTAVVFINLAAANTYTGSGGVSVAGTVISVTYGSTSNTVCQGNDSRLSDARTPVGTALAATKIWVGSVANLAAAVSLSGDGTLGNTGVLTIDATVIPRIANMIKRETPSGTVNGSNVTFTLANTPISGSEEVFLNGMLMDAGGTNDYTISTNTITFTAGATPQTGDKIRVNYTK